MPTSSPQSNLPGDIKDYLLSSEINDRNKRIIEKYKFGNEEQKKYFKIILKIILKELSFSSLPAVLISDLEIDDDKVIKLLVQDIKEIVLSPIKEYLGMDADGRQRGYEGNVLIEKAIKKFNLSLTGELLKDRFYEITDSLLSGIRTKTQFKNTLIKDIASGGLGMEHQLADDVAEFLASYIRIGKLESRNQGSIPVKPNVKIEVGFESEEKEAAGKKPKIEKLRVAAPKLLSVTEGVGKALEELNYTFPSSELQERLKSVIDARVRNVRTSVQTFDKLTQPIPDGGMGLTKPEADKVSLVLNKYLKEKNKDIYGSKLAEIKQAVDEEKNKNEEKARAAEEAERKNLDDRFTKMTGKTSPLPSVIASEARQSPPALTKKEIAAKRSGETKRPISIPAEEIPSSVILRVKPEGSRPIKAKDSSPAAQNDKPVMTPPPRPSFAKATEGRPVLEDIKFIPKLAGPTEEIARLSLDDFRKLSGDPKESILKIKDKLALIRGESYKKYQAGVDAWRNSPLFGEYLKIINKSLGEGMPLDGAIAAAGTLTKDEFDAIINSKIE